MAKIRRRFDAAIKKHGSEFGNPYGWAAQTLKQKRVTFGDIESAACQSAARPYYKMANLNVHPDSRSLAFCLGSSHNTEVILAGASNAGFEEPGQHAAFEIVLTTSLLLAPISTIDDMITLRILLLLRNQAADEFARVARRLQREERLKTGKRKASVRRR